MTKERTKQLRKRTKTQTNKQTNKQTNEQKDQYVWWFGLVSQGLFEATAIVPNTSLVTVHRAD